MVVQQVHSIHMVYIIRGVRDKQIGHGVVKWEGST